MERPEVKILGRLNRTQCCQRFATDATFLRKLLFARMRIDAEMGPANAQLDSAKHGKYNEDLIFLMKFFFALNSIKY